jgi:hypothetical protein
MNQAETVASHIRALPGFAMVAPTRYGHMGATLTDAALQAGVTWKNTVRPRAERVAQYPNAKTTSGFARLLDELGADALLNWHGRKLRTLRALVDVLLEQNVETEDQLLTWLEEPANRERLRQIKGIKNKTADYLAQDIAVDRHLSNFVAEAGVPTNSYSEAHQVIRDAAEFLGIESSTLDHSIWLYMSERAKIAAVKLCKSLQANAGNGHACGPTR